MKKRLSDHSGSSRNMSGHMDFICGRSTDSRKLQNRGKLTWSREEEMPYFRSAAH